MTDMREKVARAIAQDGFGRDWDDFYPINAHDTDQSDLLDYADAALSAMGGGVAVKPLQWFEKPDVQDVWIGRCDQISYGVRQDAQGQWGYTRHGETGLTISFKGCRIIRCEAEAMEAADHDHEARIRSALVPAAQAGGWQPIETAPKDGRWFQAVLAGEYAPGEPYLPQVLRWQGDGWEQPDEGQTVVGIKFSHWRELPAPPAAPEGDG